ncbi:MAG: YraN family protein [Gammaproteobacteria bacterium]
MSPSPSQRAGSAIEDEAYRYLETRGLRLLTRNYRTRQGEIDLVMSDGEQVVFVEVRQRRNPRYGGAAVSVDSAKQARLRAAALHYLQHHAPQAAARFDVIAFSDRSEPEWVRDAFA